MRKLPRGIGPFTSSYRIIKWKKLTTVQEDDEAIYLGRGTINRIRWPQKTCSHSPIAATSVLSKFNYDRVCSQFLPWPHGLGGIDG